MHEIDHTCHSNSNVYILVICGFYFNIGFIFFSFFSFLFLIFLCFIFIHYSFLSLFCSFLPSFLPFFLSFFLSLPLFSHSYSLSLSCFYDATKHLILYRDTSLKPEHMTWFDLASDKDHTSRCSLTFAILQTLHKAMNRFAYLPYYSFPGLNIARKLLSC